MTSTRQYLMSILALCAAQALPALGQEPILPHGDPRKQSSTEEQSRREDIRDQRLKQQGQVLTIALKGSRRVLPTRAKYRHARQAERHGRIRAYPIPA
jgi:hypothetical protein